MRHAISNSGRSILPSSRYSPSCCDRGDKTAGLPLLWRLGLLVAGCLILAFGMTIVIRSQAGTGPNDLVAVGSATS